MRELELRRSGDDRRRYEIAGVGWLRGQGWLSQRAGAGIRIPEPGGSRETPPENDADWVFEPRGWTGGKAEALDRRSGLPAGEYHGTKALAHGGEVTWGGRHYELAHSSKWRQRYQLSLDGEVVVELEVKGYGKTPVRLATWPRVDSEPGLVLFACWLCQLFVQQDSVSATTVT